MEVSPMPPKERHWLQTASTPDKPRVQPGRKLLPRRGRSAGLLCFVFNLRNFVLPRVLGLFVTW